MFPVSSSFSHVAKSLFLLFGEFSALSLQNLKGRWKIHVFCHLESFHLCGEHCFARAAI
jgi:hypothetical protein